jgi:GTP diphosphokinase / guanosine-3',5'-bis(diphosphate) 3'-diphosphatase
MRAEAALTMTIAALEEPHPYCLKGVEPSTRFLMADLCDILETYLDAAQVKTIYDAYLFSAEAHEGQQRLSGEPYIYHPVEVARILACLRMDMPTIIAALLHDVIEDTVITKAQITVRYGEQVAELVDGVSKLPQIEDEGQKKLTPADQRAANFRKMIMAMIKDIRVIVLKLADRLHNMRTLGFKQSASKRRIARETLEIYAPLASRLGMSNLCTELEELAFAALYPRRHQVISEYIRKQAGNRRELLKKITETVSQRLGQEHINAQVMSRKKRSYSFYKKMLEKKQQQKVSKERKAAFRSIKDLYGLRVIVDNVDTCYRTLGIIHASYKPKPGCFKDYIAIPKSNGYQSLHTIVMDPLGLPFEVQIRSTDMNAYAEYGIATHGLYKAGDDSSSLRRRTSEWLRSLQDIQQNTGTPAEFLDTFKNDLFPEEIYVLTPGGDIIELPRGATPVDFAYAIHSDLGHKIIAVKLDGELAPSLSAPLRTSQTVEVITANWSRPKLYWLDFVVTAKARSSIRAYFKNLKRDEAVGLGRRMLDRELERYELNVDTLSESQRSHLLKAFSLAHINDLLEEVGLGNRMAFLVARQLAPGDSSAEPQRMEQDHRHPLIIKGTEGLLVTLARCCRPIPDDPIKGYVSTGRGIVIHMENCKNAASARYKSENWIQLAWAQEPDGEFFVDIRIDVSNERGVLATLASAIAKMGVNIEQITSEHKDDGLNASIKFCLAVRGRKHLADIMRNLRRMRPVHRIHRIT